ncbi:MAG: hypothetical protein EOP54_00605 [Sphingobacteriales bacterium]|nr:MAG: hypothetical protein EOP54_00605 [Sphingobacteriales bacterium]
MKRICSILIAMLLSFAAFAQPRSAYGLVVRNLTSCDQYYVVVGDELCNCGGAYGSPVISIPPGGTHVYPNSTTIPGFPSTPKGIFGAKIPDGPAYCNVPAGAVGQPICGLPPVYGYVSIGANCIRCTMAKATWDPAINNCDDMARLTFTP